MRQFFKKYTEVLGSIFFLIAAIVVEWKAPLLGSGYFSLALYLISYLIVGLPVWLKAFRSIQNGNVFSEFMLMGIATLGALLLGEYAEGVAVMLFYMIGEHIQGNAVRKARHSITKLVDQQPDVAFKESGSTITELHPSEVSIGDVIVVRKGDKVPLDGKLLSSAASLNSSALTGESKPLNLKEGAEVWAGSINLGNTLRIEVTAEFKDTRLAGILELVQEAAQRKAPTQRFISKFAKVYTPIVVWLAVALTLFPYFIVDDYIFRDWFYRALIFLVVSCPCGLVISIPLGYFGGIGSASQNGILLKGSDYLDRLRKLTHLFIDKTGTLTEGSFKVQRIICHDGLDEDKILSLSASLEQFSSHPIGAAITQQTNSSLLPSVQDHQEHAGKGLSGKIEDQEILIGSRTFLEENRISVNPVTRESYESLVHLAVSGVHVGSIIISDQVKHDSKQAMQHLHELGVKHIVMLSGDEQAVATSVAHQLGIDKAIGNLMPDEKYDHVHKALHHDSVVGFVGDGINDAPVITLADVGIAMGGSGADATIDTADVIIQSDQPSKIPLAIEISRFTHRIVWQNIFIALGIKVLVMILATYGLATMWEAIFADVGVALIAIANAVRVQYHFSENLKWTDLFSADTQKIPAPSVNESESCCETCGCQ